MTGLDSVASCSVPHALSCQDHSCERLAASVLSYENVSELLVLWDFIRVHMKGSQAWISKLLLEVGSIYSSSQEESQLDCVVSYRCTSCSPCFGEISGPWEGVYECDWWASWKLWPREGNNNCAAISDYTLHMGATQTIINRFVFSSVMLSRWLLLKKRLI